MLRLGRVLVLGLLCAACATPPPPVPVTEGGCAVGTADAQGRERMVALPSLRVLEQTARQDTFVLPIDAPYPVDAVLCERSSVVPARDDYKVLLSGRPFYIAATDGPHPMHVVVFELVGGRVRVRVLEGTLTPEERAQIQGRLEEFQERGGRSQGSAVGGGDSSTR